jgi:hypothetical protein
MIVIAGAILGGLWGGRRAKVRGGRAADIAQYAAVHALIFALLGLALTIAIERLG